ncbi:MULTISPECIES: ABC transporter ATP-binding protein [Tsukamurella]|uniref:ABC transporter ATP-binding protein n=2 Tax=Tsukamurella TaxID=2060 RepID=A0A3P8M9R3_TSUPA|nr:MULTISPECIES: ABC transporter ATP-binding protein [Tsukamurella]AUN39590.1 taurine ABC transporter ATP-binding protein [Tsukamurella tyrosinosolvens]KXO97314.1 taurine ABC transporter ATP-binding protein [Tsukamurella tyrosinosolvens]KXP02839.1 taurine ABC transporter ATP-binding protein [Tsukamurella tyrosinosolvens]KZL97038.1 taurine ABC transporter ATP-binding protein [Tsukamurella tyrosinosolvens]MBS4101748.1 ABC transporter ATP-binding protein [Tsukamurella paurometabola]
MTGTERVELTGLGKTYDTASGQTVALQPTDLTIEPGEFVSIVGPSGCGKTTLLRLIAGFEDPTEGVVEVGGARVTAPSADRGVVFQAPTLYPWLTVRGNVEFGPKVSGVGKAERREQAQKLLDLVGLGDFGDKRPYELSGGMQQRAQIARVLVNDPAIVLMDEPYGALDALTRERLQVDLLKIWREAGKTIVFITHSVEEAVFLSTRVLVMSARPGRVVIDRKVELPGDGPDTVRDPSVTGTPEFQALRTELAAAIYAAHG